MTLADRIVLLNKGKIEQIGTPMELYNKPASVFVGGFIGNPPMNFIPGDVASHFLKLSNLNSNTVAGIRPEKIKIINEYNIQDKNIFIPLIVNMFEAIGHENYIYGKIEGTNSEIIIKSSNVNLDENKKIFIKILEDDVHIFQKESGLKV